MDFKKEIRGVVDGFMKRPGWQKWAIYGLFFGIFLSQLYAYVNELNFIVMPLVSLPPILWVASTLFGITMLISSVFAPILSTAVFYMLVGAILGAIRSRGYLTPKNVVGVAVISLMLVVVVQFIDIFPFFMEQRITPAGIYCSSSSLCPPTATYYGATLTEPQCINGMCSYGKCIANCETGNICQRVICDAPQTCLAACTAAGWTQGVCVPNTAPWPSSAVVSADCQSGYKCACGTAETTTIPAPACYDSDGENWKVKGYVEVNGVKHWDTCNVLPDGRRFVLERTCVNNKLFSESISCRRYGDDYTCEDGRCVQAAPPAVCSFESSVIDRGTSNPVQGVTVYNKQSGESRITDTTGKAVLTNPCASSLDLQLSKGAWKEEYSFPAGVLIQGVTKQIEFFVTATPITSIIPTTTTTIHYIPPTTTSIPWWDWWEDTTTTIYTPPTTTTTTIYTPPTTTTTVTECVEGWTCKDSYRVFLSKDCSEVHKEFCSKGCIGGECSPTPITLTTTTTLHPTRCTHGEMKPCILPDGSTGEMTCVYGGWSACVAKYFDGETRVCVTASGETGTQTYSGGRWGTCSKAGIPAWMILAGVGSLILVLFILVLKK